MGLFDPDGKESACNVGDLGWIPGSGRSPGGEHGNPLQCSCLENPMDRGAWWATVCGVTKSQTQLKWLSMYAHLVSCSTALSLIRPMSKIGTKPVWGNCGRFITNSYVQLLLYIKCIIWAGHLPRKREPHSFHSSQTVDVSFLLTEQVRGDEWVSSGPPSCYPQ